MVGDSEDIQVNFPEFITVLDPREDKKILGEFMVNGTRLSDIHGTAHLSTNFSNQTSAVTIQYSNIENKKYQTTVEVTLGKMQILKTQKIS